MSLTNYQIKDLGKRMGFDLAGCFFKDELPSKLQFNKSYVVNLQDEYDEDGEENVGSHWTCFQINKYPNGVVEGIYFDPFGAAPPQDVDNAFVSTIGKKVPYTDKQIQPVDSDLCGWYCCAFLHWINSNPLRTKELYLDVSHFLAMFDDLSKSLEYFKKNEYILRHFFRSKDPALRNEIAVDDYSQLENNDSAIPVNVEGR